MGLGPVRARDLTLACQLYRSLIPKLRARQRCKEGDEIVDLGFRQGQGLNVFVEIRVFETAALVVVVDHIPQRLLRAVVKVRGRHQYIANIRCLNGGDVGLLLGDQTAAKRREIRYDSGLIDRLCATRVDELLGLTCQGDDIVSDGRFGLIRRCRSLRPRARIRQTKTRHSDRYCHERPDPPLLLLCEHRLRPVVSQKSPPIP